MNARCVEGGLLKQALRRSPWLILCVAFIFTLSVSPVLWWPPLRHLTFGESFLPHASCFLWNRQLIVLHVISDLLIGVSYVAISVLLTMIAYQNRRQIPFGWMFVCFGGFIVACGVTHFMEILVLWHPFYWLEGETKAVTALLSVTTACLLPPLAPKIKQLLGYAEVSRRALREREQAHQFAKSIIESSAFTIIVTDLHGNITAVNPAAERLLWYKPNDLIGKQNVVSLYDPREVAAVSDLRAVEFGEDLKLGIDALTIKTRMGVVDEAEWTFVRKDEAKVPVHVTVTSLRGASDEDGYMFTAFDITERLRSQEYIRHVATHDSLTGLPSRILFRDRLDQALARAKRFGEQVAVMMVDLDNFKRINDSLGHHAGDEALIVIAQRLREGIRTTDTVARMGGDEFMVILCDVREKMVDALATNLLRSLSMPISLGSQEVILTASIGVCREAGDAEPISMLKHADIALYKSKAEGKNQIFHYTADMTHATVERLQMEASLRSAVMNDELSLLYQPQVSLKTGQMMGVEALVRWPRGGGEVTQPAQFIPMAEETGLIVTIGEWVLNRACNEGVRLNKALGREILMAVNMSPRQFKDRGVFHIVRNALERSGLPPRCLELEITENVLMQASKETLDGLTRIRELGVHIAIDDFGTGFSSMSYITRFEIDRLKIDQSFMQGLLKDANSRAVVTAIIAMAHGLGVSVVAEGTEKQEEADFLMGLECDEAQGYLYSRPVDPQSVIEYAKRTQS